MAGRKRLYRVPIFARKKPASDIPAWNPEAGFFLPVNLATLAVIRAVLSHAVDNYFWVGTEQEIDTAVQALHEQVSEVALRKEDICEDEPPIQWGADFRIIQDGEGDSVFQAMQGEGLPPPPWEFRFDIRSGVRWLQYRTEGSGLWQDVAQMPTGW